MLSLFYVDHGLAGLFSEPVCLEMGRRVEENEIKEKWFLKLFGRELNVASDGTLAPIPKVHHLPVGGVPYPQFILWSLVCFDYVQRRMCRENRTKKPTGVSDQNL